LHDHQSPGAHQPVDGVHGKAALQQLRAPYNTMLRSAQVAQSDLDVAKSGQISSRSADAPAARKIS
jgi:hypothetical protein